MREILTNCDLLSALNPIAECQPIDKQVASQRFPDCGLFSRVTPKIAIALTQSESSHRWESPRSRMVAAATPWLQFPRLRTIAGRAVPEAPLHCEAPLPYHRQPGVIVRLGPQVGDRATGILPVRFMARTCPDAFDRDGHVATLDAASPPSAIVSFAPDGAPHLNESTPFPTAVARARRVKGDRGPVVAATRPCRAWKDHDPYQKSFELLLRDLKA